MDGFQLTAVIFQSIAAFAWPIAFIVIAAMFKGKLTELLPLMRGKYKDVEIWFQKAEQEAKALPPPRQMEMRATPANDRFVQVAKVSPQAAMLELRAALDERLRILAEINGVQKGSRPVSLLGAIKGLQKQGVIDSSTAALLNDLRVMGNTAAHTTEAFSESDALRYRSLVEQVMRVLPPTEEVDADFEEVR